MYDYFKKIFKKKILLPHFIDRIIFFAQNSIYTIQFQYELYYNLMNLKLSFIINIFFNFYDLISR